MRSPSAPIDSRTRTFLLDDEPWTVEECGGTNGRFDDPCLVFISAHLLRRVWIYPQTWFGLTDMELGLLCCNRAARVQPK